MFCEASKMKKLPASLKERGNNVLPPPPPKMEKKKSLLLPLSEKRNFQGVTMYY